jgi:hypothetical protein
MRCKMQTKASGTARPFSPHPIPHGDGSSREGKMMPQQQPLLRLLLNRSLPMMRVILVFSSKLFIGFHHLNPVDAAFLVSIYSSRCPQLIPRISVFNAQKGVYQGYICCNCCDAASSCSCSHIAAPTKGSLCSQQGTVTWLVCFA